jgi:NADPH2:quinone reductase
VDGLAIEDGPDPAAGAGEVVIAVRAAGVSFVDGLIVAGGYQVKPALPFTPGLTVAGDVVEIGAGVSDVAVGARVASTSMGLGGYASHRVVPASALNVLPDGVGYDVAASAVESYATMLFALTRRVTVTDGEWMVVLGAGGGIGLAAADVGHSLGARVIAAASSEAKRAAALQAGAEVAIDYSAEDLKARVREITGGGADLVVDPVGDRYSEPALRSLRPFGRHLVVGFAGGSIPKLPANLILLENRAVVGIDWGAWSRRDPDGNVALVDEAFAGIAAGRFHPPLPTVFPLEKAGAALILLARRQVTGKLVLVP